MGRCHVLWFSFFVLTIVHPSLSISSVLKFVPVSHLYLDRPSRQYGWIFIKCWGGSQKVETLFQWIPFPVGFLVFPFYESTCHSSFWFPSSFLLESSPLFGCPSLYSQQGFNTIRLWVMSSIFESVFSSSHVHIELISFHVISWHFILTWLLSLSLSRRGIMWRSCGTGFCDCGGVGESGPGVDGF